MKFMTFMWLVFAVAVTTFLLLVVIPSEREAAEAPKKACRLMGGEPVATTRGMVCIDATAIIKP